jgi:hypothetical protein
MSAGDQGETSGPRPGIKISMENYSSETFEPYVGKTLLFEGPADGRGGAGDRVELELLEVIQQQSGSPRAGFRKPFTLLFALRSSTPLGNGLHKIVHDRFEACDWFLNRVSLREGDPRTAYYQAVFG